MRKKLPLSLLVGSFALALLCVVSLGVASFWVPDSVSVFEDGEYPSYPCFSFSEEGDSAKLCLFGVIPLKEVSVKRVERTSLIPGGFVFGVKVFANGVTVAGLRDGDLSPAGKAGICVGDVIVAVNGKSVSSAHDVTEAIDASLGAPLLFTIRRNGALLSLSVTPALTSDGKYKTGMWVKDTASGIGTVTYVDPKTGEFGGLGHGICDPDSGKLVEMKRGCVTGVHIRGIVEGKAGSPGEIRGTLLSEKKGSLLQNTEEGVFGVLGDTAGLGEAIPIALSHEVKTGDATLLCTLEDGVRREYTVCIATIHHTDGTKCFTVKVTDEALLSQTGGIVQGMSGSPIIQNGKLVGAVTHVMINDPTTGYGIFIENMLGAAQMPMAKAS